MAHSYEEIGARMDGLGLWKRVADHNWAVRPRGSVYPYFCTVVAGDADLVKARFLLLEGWQTFHDFVHVRYDRNYGFCCSPIELPHFELVLLKGAPPRLFRHDAGYMPAEVAPERRPFVEKMLWEAFGFMLRFESDNRLPMKYFDDGAIFSRVETADGVWEDAPLPFLPPRPHAETVTYPKELLKQVADLPMAAAETVDVDFRLLPNVMTREARPRCVYALVGVDAVGKKIFDRRVSVHPEAGLRGIWESMPICVLREFAALGRMPGELRICSGRVFRLLRTMCVELPVKLTLKDELPALDAAFKD